MGDEVNPLNQLTPFSEHVRTMHAGAIDSEITEKLGELVKAVKENGGKATLTIVVTVKSASKDNEIVTVDFTKIEGKEPAPARPPALMYAGADGDLHRHNPNQGKLPLADVTAPRRQFQDI